MSEIITGAEALMRSLQMTGVKTIFGYPGGAIMPVFDALYDYTRGDNKVFNHILVRHEQAAAHAAEGYARVSGEVGVCLVTSGPGVTNTLTGVADAMMDSTPIVVIAGQVGVGALGTDAFQEVDLVDNCQMELSDTLSGRCGLGGEQGFLYRTHRPSGAGGARFPQECTGTYHGVDTGKQSQPSFIQALSHSKRIGYPRGGGVNQQGRASFCPCRTRSRVGRCTARVAGIS